MTFPEFLVWPRVLGLENGADCGVHAQSFLLRTMLRLGTCPTARLEYSSSMKSLRRLLMVKRCAAILGIAATLLHVALFSLHVTSSLSSSLAFAAGPKAAQLALNVHALCGPGRASDPKSTAGGDGNSDRDTNSNRYQCPICLGSVAAACLEATSLVLLTKLEFEHAPLQPIVQASTPRVELRLSPGTIRGPPIV